MKKKLLKLRLSSFFGQGIRSKGTPGNMPELIKPEPQWKRAESVIEDILRWADDGGKMLDLDSRKARSDPATMQEKPSE